MAINPASQTPTKVSPINRANDVNDPDFVNQQGYYPYDLSHQEFCSPRFGEVTPKLHLDTVPGDRFVIQDDSKTILNQIDGNLLNKVNQYVDTFYVPLRACFPNNFEKLIPNPNKGSDLPNSALPQFPLSAFIKDYLFSEDEYTLLDDEGTTIETQSLKTLVSGIRSDYMPRSRFAVSRMILLSYVFSRGQLLDYLGMQFDDTFGTTPFVNNVNLSDFQYRIESFLSLVYEYSITDDNEVLMSGVTPSLTSNRINVADPFDVPYRATTLSQYRQYISDILEAGKMPIIHSLVADPELDDCYQNLLQSFYEVFINSVPTESLEIDLDAIDASADPYAVGFVNISKPLAYQLCIAQYYTNSSVDNIFNSDLFMQLLRASMFPSDDRVSKEPTFTYNGVSTEYDYISLGALYYSLLTDDVINGHFNRQYVFMTLMFLMRRSLRYGDYLTTARRSNLAVGNLEINVVDGKVSPVETVHNLLAQRYLNAVNYIGSGFLPYYNSIYGVTPSDTGCFPRFIAHRKVALDNQITNNTAQNQGHQTTNLIGFTDEVAIDVFIDDFGFIISNLSYDVLPVYTSGVDATYHLADRFDYFNPMMQGIGDQPIHRSEIFGQLNQRAGQFGWTMRNAEYKFKLSRAHGALVNELPSFLLRFPLYMYDNTAIDDRELRIDSDFIRDKACFLDALFEQRTGISPASYYHFVVSNTNVVHCARKMQITPPVLF